jgi:hypothetical protein
LARLAFPEIHAFFTRVEARRVAEAVETVRDAAVRFHAETRRWPRDAATGEVPPELQGFLPEGFRFEGAGYRLDWERWTLPDGLPQAPTARGLVGVSVVTPDLALGRAVAHRFAGGASALELDDTHTILFAALP